MHLIHSLSDKDCKGTDIQTLLTEYVTKQIEDRLKLYLQSPNFMNLSRVSYPPKIDFN